MDEREWLVDGEARALSELPEDCPVCDGTGYTAGVTVRHPCYNCNPAFHLDTSTDELVEVYERRYGLLSMDERPRESRANFNRTVERYAKSEFGAREIMTLADVLVLDAIDSESRSNAAVNNHAALVEALRALMNHIRPDDLRLLITAVGGASNTVEAAMKIADAQEAALAQARAVLDAVDSQERTASV